MNSLKITIFFVISLPFFWVSTAFSQNKYNTQSAKLSNNTISIIANSEANDEKVLALGSELQNAIFENSVENYLNLLDYESFGNLITKDIEEDKDIKEFKTGFLNGLKQGMKSIPNKIIEEVNGAGYYDFVNYRYDETTQTYHMLFRLYSSLTGINYHDYRVSRINGKFMFNDIYIYLSGEELSKTFRRFFIYNLPKTSLFDLFGEDNTDEFIKMANAVNYHNQGQFEKALNMFNKIEGDLQYDKFLLVIKAVCASNVNEEAYKKAMKTIADKYPDDSSLYLSQIDYHLMNKNYETALSLITRLEKDTDDDFLNLLKGNLEFDRANYTKSLEYFKYISDNYPDFFEGHSSYLTVLSTIGDYTKCVTFLSSLTADGYSKADLIEFVEETDENGENNLLDLVNSEAYNKWKKI